MAKLEQPFPSSPHRPPKHTLSFYRGDKRIRIESFGATYSAKKYVDAIVGDNDISWRGEDAFFVADLGVAIKGDTLEDIMEHEFTPAEKAWELPQPHATEAEYIATGERKRVQSAPVTASASQKEPNVQQRPKRSGPPRAVPDGLIGIATICEEVGMAPRDARAILRKKATKPEHGAWAWSPEEAKKIKQLLSGKDDGGDKTPTPRRSKDDVTGDQQDDSKTSTTRGKAQGATHKAAATGKAKKRR